MCLEDSRKDTAAPGAGLMELDTPPCTPALLQLSSKALNPLEKAGWPQSTGTLWTSALGPPRMDPIEKGLSRMDGK